MAKPDYDLMSDDEVLERCRAARAFFGEGSIKGSEDEQRFAFMRIFHPEKKMTREEVKEMFQQRRKEEENKP